MREHFHPPLTGVLDFRGKTSLRQLINLVYRSSGVVCPITSLMHLVAAVPSPSQSGELRPGVVVAGGREPVGWFSYPAHQVIHTIGALDCCARGGCWKSRTIPLGDGETLDEPDHLCVNVVEGMPRCTSMIDPADVTKRIALFYEGNSSREYLEAREWPEITPHLRNYPAHFPRNFETEFYHTKTSEA